MKHENLQLLQFAPHTTQQIRQRLAQLATATPPCLYLRDGEVVVYLRDDSPYYQCRYKLADGSWHRASTRKASIEFAVTVACELYDEARFRQRLGLAHRTHSIAQIAAETIADLRRDIDLGRGKVIYKDYIACIERYIAPYFAETQLEQLTNADIAEFELWRNRQMRKQPTHSTLNTFTSAWNKICSTAVARGWISERVPVPKLSTMGAKSVPRPAFTRDEITYLQKFMETWIVGGRKVVTREIKPLLRDYVEMLLYTGMRHGTEAMGICWNNIEWHTNKSVRYLRIWVSGKTGGRWLIAKHAAVDVLKRLHQRQESLSNINFEDLLKSKNKNNVFAYSNGTQPHDLRGTFRLLMQDSKLLKDAEGQNRTLYSLRHTYATLELLENNTDIHTLAKQMGNSAAMIERHYSKLTPTMAADRLA
jgi:integrase